MNQESDTPLDRIFIDDLHLRCIIGLQEWERHTLQDVLVNLVLFTDLAPAGHSDQVADTVDYKHLTKGIVAFVEGSSFQLVEALAAGIAGLCLENPRVAAVRVRVEKPGALRFSRTVGVEIERRRPLPAGRRVPVFNPRR